MKKILFGCVLLLLSCLQTEAQTRRITLAWEDSNGPGILFDIEVSNATCSTATIWVAVVSDLALKTYDHLNRPPGNYCYRVFSKTSTVRSVASNLANAVVPIIPPFNLTANFSLALIFNGTGTITALNSAPKGAPLEIDVTVK